MFSHPANLEKDSEFVKCTRMYVVNLINNNILKVRYVNYINAKLFMQYWPMMN
jgi:hypothetical protein